jgi:flagellin
LSRSGLQAGTFAAQTAQASSSSNTGTAFGAGDFTINGVSLGASLASDDKSSSTGQAGSAIAKAAAINRASSQTGVTATANATVANGAAIAAGAGSGTITINGIATGTIDTLAAAGSEAENRARTVQAINAISGQTGVVAVDTNDNTTGVKLVAADGRNIAVSFGGTVTSGNTGVTATATTYGTISLSSTKSFTIENGTSATAGTTNLGINVGTYGSGRTGQALSTVDISTVDGANKALTAIDNALASVNSSRASMGAVQNRFSAVVSNLQSTSENLSASRSRIRDADFAAETANLSRGQILQQAGTAMLAQANSLPNGVLSLLRG